MLEVDPQLINVAKMSENYLTEINQLIQVTDTPKRKSQPAKPAPEYKTNLSPLQREIFWAIFETARNGKIRPKG